MKTNNNKTNKDKTKLQNRASYVKCPECGFIRNVIPEKHKDPSWDKLCHKCNRFKVFKEKFPIGFKFGEWTIKNHEVEKRGNFSMINVVCSCGFETSLNKWTLETDKTKSCCKCGYKKKFKGFGEISNTYFNKIKSTAVDRNLSFNVNIEYIWDLFLKQNRKCAISGCDLTLTNSNQFKLQSASLDRIDSQKGYEIGNLQWVHKYVNKMKMDLPEEIFFHHIKEIYEFKQLNALTLP